MFSSDDAYWLLIGFITTVLGLALVVASKFLLGKLVRFNLDEQLFKQDNPALGLATVGYFAAVVIVFLGAVVGSGDVYVTRPTWAESARTLGLDLLWAVCGVLALSVSRIVVDRLVLYGFSTRKEIIEDRNAGTGAVEAGCLIASALVIAGAIHGDGGVLSAVIFYLLGQLALILFGLLYRVTCGYDVHREIEADNIPAGVALGMNMAAIGLILLKATAGDLESWTYNLAAFGVYAIAGVILLIALRQVVDWLLVPAATLTEEVVRDRSLNAAWIEGTLALGIASMLFFLL